MQLGIQYLDDGELSSTFIMRDEEFDLWDGAGRYYALASTVELELDVDWDTGAWEIDSITILGSLKHEARLERVRQLDWNELRQCIINLPKTTREHIAATVDEARGIVPDENDEHRHGKFEATGRR